MVAGTLSLVSALGVEAGEVVAFVGGGGKTASMFRLAAELLAGGGRVLTTSTTRMAQEQTRLAPVHVSSTAELARAGASSAHVLLTGAPEPGTGKVFGIPPEQVCALRASFSHVLIEADGARGLPFKAPAAHEPVIPACATLVVALAGIDALDKPLSPRWVHRPESVARIHGGATVTRQMIAAVLAHPQGALKNVPPAARVVPLINKVRDRHSLEAAREIARLVLASAPVARVAIGAFSAEPLPVIAICAARQDPAG
ncbi:MAG: putative selenium-dependent hydroxylase accessory protein YqeC [Burkholderiales bacterium]|nr:putative selenium-dependent hydroxylase accessory protein YqeC [Burkholderiales bacterium]